jgi:pimeloyl-ACP methyl ester carboxylesterase
MRELASQGILCITIKMPFNLAVFNINGADEVRDKFSKVESWYIGGHSLGGSMVCSYLEENHTRYKGLILLASYSTSDLSKTNLKVLSVFGTNDKVLNMEKYNENLKNIDTSLAEIKIEGGNHAQFGMYGRQDGDGEAIISNEKQIRDTAEVIFDFMK